MAEKAAATAVAPATAPTGNGQAKKGDTALRQPAETKYADELAYLASVDTGPKPFEWRLSPRMIRTFVLGAQPGDKLDREVKQKFYGDPTVVERAIVTLAS